MSGSLPRRCVRRAIFSRWRVGYIIAIAYYITLHTRTYLLTYPRNCCIARSRGSCSARVASERHLTLPLLRGVAVVKVGSYRYTTGRLGCDVDDDGGVGICSTWPRAS